MKIKKNHIILIIVVLLVIGGILDWFAFQNRDENPKEDVDQVTILKSQAEEWIMISAPTYVFDGSELVFIESKQGECEFCHELIFSFQSSNGGYGAREGLFITQVITPHTLSVFFENWEIVRAITDGKYNEMTGALGE